MVLCAVGGSRARKLRAVLPDLGLKGEKAVVTEVRYLVSMLGGFDWTIGLWWVKGWDIRLVANVVAAGVRAGVVCGGVLGPIGTVAMRGSLSPASGPVLSHVPSTHLDIQDIVAHLDAWIERAINDILSTNISCHIAPQYEEINIAKARAAQDRHRRR